MPLEGLLSVATRAGVFAAVRETGATQPAAPTLLGRQRSVSAAQSRLVAPVALLSAFINKTPVVSVYLPLVRRSAQRIGVSPSNPLMALSVASLPGGRLTVIGSASNLIVMGLSVECLRAENVTALIWPLAFRFRPEP